jgi:type II secretory pathway pseudopilin PulG
MMKLKTKRGMSFVEMMFSLFIFSLTVTVVTGVYIMALRMHSESRAQSLLFAESAHAIEMMQRGETGVHGLMKARSGSVVIDAGGDRIDYLVDQNNSYTVTTADDTQMRIYYDNGDSDDTTLGDNVIRIETGPVATAVNFAVGRNIESLNFAMNGDLITVVMTVAEQVRGRTVRLTLTRNILMRN